MARCAWAGGPSRGKGSSPRSPQCYPQSACESLPGEERLTLGGGDGLLWPPLPPPWISFPAMKGTGSGTLSFLSLPAARAPSTVNGDKRGLSLAFCLPCCPVRGAAGRPSWAAMLTEEEPHTGVLRTRVAQDGGRNGSPGLAWDRLALTGFTSFCDYLSNNTSF